MIIMLRLKWIYEYETCLLMSSAEFGQVNFRWKIGQNSEQHYYNLNGIPKLQVVNTTLKERFRSHQYPFGNRELFRPLCVDWKLNYKNCVFTFAFQTRNLVGVFKKDADILKNYSTSLNQCCTRLLMAQVSFWFVWYLFRWNSSGIIKKINDLMFGGTSSLFFVLK